MLESFNEEVAASVLFAATYLGIDVLLGSAPNFLDAVEANLNPTLISSQATISLFLNLNKMHC